MQQQHSNFLLMPSFCFAYFVAVIGYMLTLVRRFRFSNFSTSPIRSSSCKLLHCVRIVAVQMLP